MYSTSVRTTLLLSLLLSIFTVTSLPALDFSTVIEQTAEIDATDLTIEEQYQCMYSTLLSLAEACERSVATGNSRNGIRHLAVALAWRKYGRLSSSLLKTSPNSQESVESRTHSLYMAFTRKREVKRLFLNFLNKEPPELLALLERSTGKKMGPKHVTRSSFLNFVGAAYGQIVGSISWRTQGRINSEGDIAEQLQPSLQPLDILFERKTYKLSNYSIPGYWGHVAIHTGTREQLESLGIWEAEELDPFRKHIENGQVIFEVRKSGTRHQSFDKWLNMDAVAVARKSGLLQESDNEDILKVFKALGDQFGKRYDFAFDIVDTHRVACTELIFLAYGDVEWPTRSFMGCRYIAPDDVAQVVCDPLSSLQFVAYFDSRGKDKLKYLGEKDFASRIGIVETDSDLLASTH